MLKRIKKTYKRRYTKRKQASILEQGNCFLSESEDKKRRKNLSYFILALAALLVIIPCLFLLKTRIEQAMFIASEQEILKEQKAVTLVMLFYKNQKGYAQYCQSQGVVLENYPKIFSDRYQTHQVVLDHYLKEKKGLSLEQAYSKLRANFSRVIDKAVLMNFNLMATSLAPYQKEEKTLSHKDICEILENSASDIIQSDLNPDYLRIQEAFNVLNKE